jgi:signal transduction histidine kinase
MSKEFLRGLQFFAGLPEADLDWLSAQAEPVLVRAGENLMEEGAPGDAAYVVVDGEFEVVKKSDAQSITIAVREPGEVIGEMALLDQAPRSATVRAVRESQVLKIRGETFQRMLLNSSSAALSLLQTVTRRLRQNEGLLRQSEKMAALGTLAAGLAHELNNPAAAVRRSSDQLRSALTTWSRLTLELARAQLSEPQIESVEALRLQIESQKTSAASIDPMLQSDRESEVQAWLEGLGVQDAWEVAPALVMAGWDVKRLADLEGMFGTELLLPLLRWLAAGCLAYSLLDEVDVGTGRISEIVRSVKAYSYLDQGPIQEVDIHEGLENTLVILRHKLKQGVQVTRQYAADLPHIEAHGSELNQVWTNILDNAIDAMHGQGEIVLRTCKSGENISVEIQDNGPGIPAAIQKRIFEPFFTTKPPGQGTGQGLNITYNIINNHHGKIRVASEPGKTIFEITLPIHIPR